MSLPPTSLSAFGLGSGLGMPSMGLSSPLLGAAGASTSPSPSFSNFSNTGIQSVAGNGYAYPPGSDMVKFMDNVNNTVAAACQAPGGGSITDWANGLAAQQKQRQALAGGSTGALTGGATGASSLPQMFQMLMSMMAALQQFQQPATGA